MERDGIAFMYIRKNGKEQKRQTNENGNVGVQDEERILRNIKEKESNFPQEKDRQL